MLWFDEVGSTQDVLKEYNLPYGAVVVANRQRAGRGRLGRVWHSQEGGLYFSFLLNPKQFKDLLPLPLVVGYALVLLLENEGFFPMLKWVNDVYVKGKKVCGVLVERTSNKLIVGVGINLNQKDFPKDINASSLYLISGKTFEKKDILLKTLDIFKDTLQQYSELGFGVFKEPIKQRLMFLGQEVIVYAQEPAVGIFEDIDQDGGLLLRTAKGTVKFNAGEVSLRSLQIP